MSDVDETILYEQFIAAREAAIVLSDRFASIPQHDPNRDKLWDDVMRQTEAARVLLERWLKEGKLIEQSTTGATPV